MKKGLVLVITFIGIIGFVDLVGTVIVPGSSVLGQEEEKNPSDSKTSTQQSSTSPTTTQVASQIGFTIFWTILRLPSQ